MFETDDKVDIVQPLWKGDACSFVGKSGTVSGHDGKWVLVVVDGEKDKTPIGFREHELAKTN